jgi:predicted nucleic acid-binding protein
VESFLQRRFQVKLLTLPGSGHRSLLKTAREGGISGGSACDALVAATAKHAGASLLTRGRRAVRIYEPVGVTFRMV